MKSSYSSGWNLRFLHLLGLYVMAILIAPVTGSLITWNFVHCALYFFVVSIILNDVPTYRQLLVTSLLHN